MWLTNLVHINSCNFSDRCYISLDILFSNINSMPICHLHTDTNRNSEWTTDREREYRFQAHCTLKYRLKWISKNIWWRLAHIFAFIIKIEINHRKGKQIGRQNLCILFLFCSLANRCEFVHVFLLTNTNGRKNETKFCTHIKRTISALLLMMSSSRCRSMIFTRYRSSHDKMYTHIKYVLSELNGMKASFHFKWYVLGLLLLSA